MHETLNFSAAFLIGLLGSAHCVGMCGGIMGALAYAVPAEQRTPKKLFPLLLCYNLGRILSYTVAGALIGASSWFLAGQFPQLGTLLRIIAGLMLIAMGLYLANWWAVLRHLERAGSKVWKHIQPKLSALMPVNSPWRAVLVGTLWGWIPCGLIYSTLTWAATASDWQQSALMMFFFGLGTLPAVLATGLFLEAFKKLFHNRGIRSGAGLLIIAFGVWTLPLHGYHNHAHNEQQAHRSQQEMHHSEMQTPADKSMQKHVPDAHQHKQAQQSQPLPEYHGSQHSAPPIDLPAESAPHQQHH